MTAEERRAYQSKLDALKRPLAEGNPWIANSWQANAVPRLDDSGNPELQVKLGDETVDLGLSRSNILGTSAPPEMAESILLLRLREELKNGEIPKVSERDAGNDWQLLQQVLLQRHRRPEEIDARLGVVRSSTP